jgi:hypothetical protein
MKAFLGGIAAIIVVSVGAVIVLDAMGFSSQEQFTSERGSVRLGDG